VAARGDRREAIAQPSVWDGPRHQVFLGSEAFVQRHCVPSMPTERLREIPRAQHRPLATPLAESARRYSIS